MRTIGLISALAAGLWPIPTLLAQPAPTFALNSMPLSAPGLDGPALHAAASDAADSALPLPNAPVPAITAISNLVAARPCSTGGDLKRSPDADSGDQEREPCVQQAPNPYSRFLDTSIPVPLTPAQKGALATRNFIDPGNLATVLGTAAFIVSTNAHTAYGPGLPGFRNATGYILSQDATGEFFGTFLIPSLTHQDPHYRRMPQASIPRRTLHAVAATVVAQSDDGRRMPNYSALLTDPICNELANLYMPGINGNGPSTAARILTGYATDPVDNLITEFLPDVARHIHVHVIFVQQILNQMGNDQSFMQ
jgi:hypothetical protein